MKKLSTGPCGGIGAKAAAALLCAVFAAVLAGCGGSPYVDSRREAGQKTLVGASTPDRIAICYSDYGTTVTALQAMAESECAKTGRTAVFESSDYLACTLLTPSRAYYRCVEKTP